MQASFVLGLRGKFMEDDCAQTLASLMRILVGILDERMQKGRRWKPLGRAILKSLSIFDIQGIRDHLGKSKMKEIGDVRRHARHLLRIGHRDNFIQAIMAIVMILNPSK